MGETSGILGPNGEPARNGEHLRLQRGSTVIGITVRDLIPILLVIGTLAGGYLIYGNVIKMLERIHVTQQQFQQSQHQAIGEVRKMLLTLDYNMQRPPQDHIPLELDPAQVPRKREEER